MNSIYAAAGVTGGIGFLQGIAIGLIVGLSGWALGATGMIGLIVGLTVYSLCYVGAREDEMRERLLQDEKNKRRE